MAVLFLVNSLANNIGFGYQIVDIGGRYEEWKLKKTKNHIFQE